MSIQPSSVITQVSATVPSAALHPFVSYDEQEKSENIQLNLRGVIFNISREELLRLPESILIGITNGALYDQNTIGGASLADANAATANTLSPECFKYTLDVFRSAAKGLPRTLLSIEGSEEQGFDDAILGVDEDTEGKSANSGVAMDADGNPKTETVSDISEILRRRPAIIVLREDLDYYCLPNGPNVDAEGMRQIKHSCGEAILNQRRIFGGLRKGESENSPEHHLIAMLCSSGFQIDDDWGFRAREPHKTVVSSLALIRLKMVDEQHHEQSPETQQELSTPQKLLLFWRKPARKCWWDSIELNDVPGVDGPVRVHIRRVWTLELSVIGVR
ncbi:Whi2p [Sugiyamaella lignohabitans]|uniref:Whi2p n=1 Tax=Sugiyamaella lignohabitans TaxID=796027 RepID=A0A161HIG4_9ASCO|nr:Whi2p [Sugiyamaella lignohabitans]ANB10928.1 Whi2p [Sugiyamaella lignohabitans]